MAKKKSRVKRSVASKPLPEKCCSGHCGMLFAKLSAMAFILFLLTVWPAFMSWVHTVHWGWFLGATIVFMMIAMTNHYKKY